MPGAHFEVRMTETEIAEAAEAVMADTARRLARCAFRPMAGVRTDEARALAHLHALLHLQRAAARVADHLARDAADAGSGYPDVGAALGMSRQGARKRFPDLLHRHPEES
ncbi:hypothetical protein ACIQU5_35485 [Streptomyces sp. NPDC090306]|uniref:hypothetical protein n=1 Tax=Streptomyces sp. NPDC090306 TaxID=3365961 RepID=UPI00381FF02C